MHNAFTKELIWFGAWPASTIGAIEQSLAHGFGPLPRLFVFQCALIFAKPKGCSRGNLRCRTRGATAVEIDDVFATKLGPTDVRCETGHCRGHCAGWSIVSLHHPARQIKIRSPICHDAAGGDDA